MEKLKHVLKYLKGTRNLSLNLRDDDIGIIKLYVDASFAIHNDCCGHTGGMLTLSHEAVTSFSHKQKLNTKSLTEAELIGVDDALPQILWTRYFLEQQGYSIIKNTFCQDN